MNLTDLKKGILVLYNSQPHEIMWSQFVRMQQRKPVMQTKMRNLITGRVVEYSFKSGESIESAEIAKQAAQYLYADEQGAHFMNNDTYETIDLSKDISEDKVGYLREGETVMLRYFDGKPISIELPIKVELKVKDTPPSIRGDTSAGGNKPATLETGLIIQVPLFIKEGDVIRINTERGEYVERAN
ncbi:MAG: elongation factor P [Candidatus Doudnabacteria bacterium RIFCSPHIGHO2_01_FULL_50_11]|uniref:Elongation factor P n=1 Tax=Candidatus Doudnabacteria bacterium RIFCSPHIGHO2_01_FULL_50_11 TaxID=1817828 RepID=A0A1F5PHK2_9BACT|nr:MAG: elongation factor P [Candidatus Doudnabacteria bacterium RIFCSPHIGHO2_01_FULL_50_11]HLC44223.1 elongation factor P [Patescibacteria group bacterium]